MYNKHGLQQLVPPPFSINGMVRRRIENFLNQHPKQRRSLLSGNELLLYSEWINVDDELLAAWVAENDYLGVPMPNPM
jgi:hypothetical protein